MILQTQPQQTIFINTSMQKLSQTLNNFTKQILSHFQSSLDTLNNINSKQLTLKQTIIKEQQNKIQSMFQWSNTLTQCIQGAPRFINSNPNQQNNNPSKIATQIHKTHTNITINPIIQNPIPHPQNHQDTSAVFPLQKFSSLSHPLFHDSKPITQSKPLQIPQTTNQKKPLNIEQNNELINDRQKQSRSESMQEQIQDQRQQKSTKIKLPLQASLKHELNKISMTPNITKLKYIEYEHKSALAFGYQDVQALDEFDLNAIDSVTIRNMVMQDQDFEELTQLQWPRLKSLKIDGNQITDIRCLKNLNLSRFQDLDISHNPLNIESAQFISSFPFDQLIYFTVSFDTGFDEDCWEKILQNNLNNFPKLQALDICNSNQLNSSIKKRIEQCLKEKAIQQRKLALEKGQSKYPQNYKIKIIWNESKQVYQTYDDDKIKKICNHWVKEVKFDRTLLPKLVMKGSKTSKSNKSQSSQSSKKRKMIKKNKNSNLKNEKNGYSDH